MTLRFIDASDRARLLLTGKDARAFLHRMSTQHVKDLAPGEGKLNVLITDKGRVVDMIHHLDRGASGVLLVGSRGRGEALRAWLDRFLFTEDVQIEDVSAQGGVLEVLGAPDAAAAALAPFSFIERDDVVVVRTFDMGGPAFLVVGLTQKPSSSGDEMSRVDAEAARIAAGVPGDAELSDRFNPLDLGLATEAHGAVHWNKGCYIGQEVIARLDTYAKQQKNLWGLVCDPSGIAPGAIVKSDDSLIGEVTSVSPTHNGTRPSALAVLKLKEPARLRVLTTQGEREAEARLRPDAVR